jgi:hypothetical protein
LVDIFLVRNAYAKTVTESKPQPVAESEPYGESVA